jgi:hypothetical protein
MNIPPPASISDVQNAAAQWGICKPWMALACQSMSGHKMVAKRGAKLQGAADT